MVKQMKNNQFSKAVPLSMQGKIVNHSQFLYFKTKCIESLIFTFTIRCDGN